MSNFFCTKCFGSLFTCCCKKGSFLIWSSDETQTDVKKKQSQDVQKSDGDSQSESRKSSRYAWWYTPVEKEKRPYGRLYKK